jgi:hypothetical protein
MTAPTSVMGVAVAVACACALPLVPALMNRVRKRQPDGWLAKWSWLVVGLVAVAYLAGGVMAYAAADRFGGGLLVAGGLLLAVQAAFEYFVNAGRSSQPPR